jgi:hypothetical protein
MINARLQCYCRAFFISWISIVARPQRCRRATSAPHFAANLKAPLAIPLQEIVLFQVDDKLYHCGHCNNLQIINKLDDHLEANHPLKTEVTSKLTATSSANGGCIQNKMADAPKTSADDKTNCISENVDFDNGLFEFAHFVICNHILYLRLTHFHVICFKISKVSCELCDEHLESLAHINSTSHQSLIQQTPFIISFGYNAIRRVSNFLFYIYSLSLNPQDFYIPIALYPQVSRDISDSEMTADVA